MSSKKELSKKEQTQLNDGLESGGNNTLNSETIDKIVNELLK